MATKQNKDSLSVWRVTREQGHATREQPMDTGPYSPVMILIYLQSNHVQWAVLFDASMPPVEIMQP